MSLASAEGVKMDQVEDGEVGGLMGGEELSDDEDVEDDGEKAELLEKERAMRRESIIGMASRLYELADLLMYNAPFTDQRVVDLATRKIASAIDFHEKIRNKENRINSSTSAGIPTFSPDFAELMFFRTRPLAQVHSDRSKHQEGPKL
jgi:hypothetical protein